METKTRFGPVLGFTSEYKHHTVELLPKVIEWAQTAQITSSENHSYRNLGKGGDVGGPFATARVDVALGGPMEFKRGYVSGSPYGERAYCLPLGGPDAYGMLQQMNKVMTGQITFPALVKPVTDHELSESNIANMGARAVAAVRPTNPTVDLSVSLAEFLSERKFFALPGKAGSVEGEYLNYMFGVAPTISDAQDLRYAIANKEKILAQYRRDRGKTVRRSFEFEPIRGTTYTTSPNILPTFGGHDPSANFYGRGVGKSSVTISQRTWFDGAFTYWYPDEGFGKTIAELDRLYGVRPDVGTAWELLPFSWLLDYKLSTGAAIQNMAAFQNDGLVMQFGYLMTQTEVQHVESWTGPMSLSAGTRTDMTIESTWKYTSKTRAKANPFGFGVSPGSLTNRQKSILAALASLWARQRR